MHGPGRSCGCHISKQQVHVAALSSWQIGRSCVLFICTAILSLTLSPLCPVERITVATLSRTPLIIKLIDGGSGHRPRVQDLGHISQALSDYYLCVCKTSTPRRRHKAQNGKRWLGWLRSLFQDLFLLLLFIYSRVHTLLGSFLHPSPPHPSPAQFQAGPVLPLSLILLKKRQKHNKENKAFLLVELRIAIQRDY
jgi:hypothetical protein